MTARCNARHAVGGRKAFAFTLIELIVVVAIIAILAAIAVSNYLESQIRAKVSRAKSDMRSMAIALESYAADKHGYPEARRDGIFLPFEDRLVRLTTPVSYMSSFPADPFPESATGQFTYGYNDRKNTEDAIERMWRPFAGFPDPQNKGWCLLSLGPDRLQSLMVGPTPTEYDATNGSVSHGDIHTYGP
jgi:prepilin-type N-terminal cleavage/methylation domain-containing protein